MSIKDAEQLNLTAQLKARTIAADPNLSDLAKREQTASLKASLAGELAALRNADLATDAGYKAKWTSVARGVKPSEQMEYLALQDRAAGFDTVGKIKVEIDRARAAGHALGLTAAGLQAYDEGNARDAIVPGSGRAFHELANEALDSDRITALNKLSDHQTADVFGLLSYEPGVR
jgi:hypothetical protein